MRCRKCIMSWKTFLELFKKDCNLFKYIGGSWYMGYVQIIINYNSFLKDGEVVFIKER